MLSLTGEKNQPVNLENGCDGDCKQPFSRSSVFFQGFLPVPPLCSTWMLQSLRKRPLGSEARRRVTGKG